MTWIGLWSWTRRCHHWRRFTCYGVKQPDAPVGHHRSSLHPYQALGVVHLVRVLWAQNRQHRCQMMLSFCLERGLAADSPLLTLYLLILRHMS